MMNDAAVVALVDTNVTVYAYDPRDRAKQARAIEVLHRLQVQDAGALSTQALSEFFITVTRLPAPLTLAEAEQEVTNFVRSWTVYDVTPRTALEAIRGVRDHQLAYYDALMWAAAKVHGVPYLLSEDFSDGRMIETVRCVNPFTPAFAIDRLLSR